MNPGISTLSMKIVVRTQNLPSSQHEWSHSTAEWWSATQISTQSSGTQLSGHLSGILAIRPKLL